MNASALLKALLLSFIAAVLAACGGSSSTGNDGGFTPPAITVTATAQSQSVVSGSTTDITVRVREGNGAAIRDGTVVNATVSPPANGTITAVDGQGAETAQGSTSGGVANFRFRGAGPGGAATVTFSVPDPNAPARTVTATVSITVTPAPDTSLRVIVEPQASVVAPQGVADVIVRVRRANGSPVADGTTVNGIVAPASAGSVLGLPAGAAPSATTSGGIANFRFLAGNLPATAQLTFSVTDAEQGNAVVTGTANITVAGVDQNRLRLQATTTTLPINAFNVAPFFGSPFMAEVTVTVRTASGQAVNAADGIQVSVNPVGNTGGFTTLNDPSTTEDEFLVRLGQGSVDVVAGQATLFMHSLNFSGTTTLTVTTTDPETNQVIVATLPFTIVSSISTLPASVSVNPLTTALYVQGSGGNSSAQVQVAVNDAIGQPVPNPTAGNNAFNNIRVELVGDAATGGARVAGINAQGQNVQGAQINLRTTSGIGGVQLVSGNNVGSALLRVTADRADNNVDNGISDPVVGQRSVFVSDGVLFDLEIAQPIVNALLVNPVDPTTTPSQGTTVPVSPDGTYSLTIGVIATDRLGNPVLPGTAINFGLIDEPQASGAGDFLIAGLDGNPEEAGRSFTAPTGAFTTAGGGVGPGDAVVLLTEEDPANRDLEGARVVQSVNGPTSLTVTRNFNRNDVTGSIFNAGNVIPYVIGRAADGNISANATTNALGVARTTLNYPVSRIGKTAVIWAQGDGAIVAGQARTVADVELVRFAGVAPATLSVSPSVIPGNTPTPVAACVLDALFVPIEGVQISFGFAGLNGGQGDVDGRPSAGSFASLTGRDGCAIGNVTTTGIIASGGTLVVSAVGQSATVQIQVGSLILSANPSAFFGSGGTTTLRLVDASGRPVPGVQLRGTCTGGGGAVISTQPTTGENGVTDANGEARWDIFADNLSRAGGAGSGSCVYTTATGSPSTTVTLQGVDLCTIPISPRPPECSTTPVSLTLILDGARTGVVTTDPAIIACTKGGVATQTCTGSFQQGSVVALFARGEDGAGDDPVFSQECELISINPDPNISAATGRALMAANRTCRVTFN